MRIRRSLATTSTSLTATTSSDPDHNHHDDVFNNLHQTTRRCSSNNNNYYSTTTTKTGSIIICVLNQSPWDVNDLSSLQLDGGLFSLTGTTAPIIVTELAICSQSLGSSVKLCDEDTKQPLRPTAASNKCLNRSENANSDGLCLPEVKIRAEKCSTGGKVVSSSKSQIRASSVKKKQMEPSDMAPKSGIKRRGRAVQKSAANPTEFYYYSGFGPHWGKKRETVNKRSKPPVVANKVILSEQELRVNNEGGNKRDIEFVDYDDDDDDDINGVENEEGARRPGGRKKVKARLLKSLM